MNETMKQNSRILVTGSAGKVGWAVCRELAAAGFAVRGLDRIATPDDACAHETIVADLSDTAGLHDAMVDCDAVIHLAADPDAYSPFLPNLCEANIVGLYNVMEAARLRGIKRVVLASSVMACMGLPWQERIIKVEEGTSPEYHYALTKVYAEHFGEMYHRVHGMEVIVFRIGWLLRSAAEFEHVNNASKSVYLSTVDAGRAFRLAIEADSAQFSGHAVVFITSKHVQQTGFDLEPAKRAIGYEPTDTFPANMHPDVGVWNAGNPGGPGDGSPPAL